MEMALNIIQEYFNYYNQKQLQLELEREESLSIKRSTIKGTPLNTSDRKCIDDSGYVSPPFLEITPLNLNECYDEAIISNVVILQTSWDHELVRTLLDTIPMKKLGAKFEINLSDFTKDFGKLFDCQNIIGRMIGRKNCDIVLELETRNISGFITELMNYLSPTDVNCMQQVSKSWHNTCSKNKLAQKKLKEFTEHKMSKRIFKEMALNIIQEYFNYYNQKQLQLELEREESLSIKRSTIKGTPLNTPDRKCIDDSGYVSPPFLEITPLNLNECYDEAIISNVVILQTSWDHELVRTLLDTIPMKKLGAKFEINLSDFTKDFGKLFDCQNIIGRMIGRKNCDIVLELETRNISGFITKLMNYLSPTDVNCMQQVSKSWHNTCSKNKLAQKKLKEFTEHKMSKRIFKENRKPKAEVQKLKVITKNDLFQQCADSLKNDEYLQKCPKCEHPAKVHPIQDKGVCINRACNFHYCSKCRTKYHDSAACIQVGVERLPREIIHTRKSKKFLRRL